MRFKIPLWPRLLQTAALTTIVIVFCAISPLFLWIVVAIFSVSFSFSNTDRSRRRMLDRKEDPTLTDVEIMWAAARYLHDQLMLVAVCILASIGVMGLFVHGQAATPSVRTFVDVALPLSFVAAHIVLSIHSWRVNADTTVANDMLRKLTPEVLDRLRPTLHLHKERSYEP